MELPIVTHTRWPYAFPVTQVLPQCLWLSLLLLYGCILLSDNSLSENIDCRVFSFGWSATLSSYSNVLFELFTYLLLQHNMLRCWFPPVLLPDTCNINEINRLVLSAFLLGIVYLESNVLNNAQNLFLDISCNDCYYLCESLLCGVPQTRACSNISVWGLLTLDGSFCFPFVNSLRALSRDFF